MSIKCEEPPEKRLNNTTEQSLQQLKAQRELSATEKTKAIVTQNQMEKIEQIEGEKEGAEFFFHDTKYHFTPSSLFCFSEKNLLRRWIVWLITWQWFDNFITLVILFNSVLLAVRSYDDRLTDGYDPTWNDGLDEIGIVLSVIFMVECVLKIFGQGFVLHKSGYLRDSWNILDFFVVVASILDFFPSLKSVSSLKVLRTFRILRPLRSVNKVPRMKMLINSLLKSIPGLCNVVIFLVFLLSIFGIFATHQFKGAQYQWCRSTEKPVNGVWPRADSAEYLCLNPNQCNAYANDNSTEFWCGSPYDVGLKVESDNSQDQELIMWNIINFDSFPYSMRSIFVAITLEGWINMTYNYADASSPWLSAIFFILLVIFGSFFALNLVLAEVMESFYSSQAEDLTKQADKKDEEENLKMKEEQENERKAMNTGGINKKPQELEGIQKVLRSNGSQEELPEIQSQEQNSARKSAAMEELMASEREMSLQAAPEEAKLVEEPNTARQNENTNPRDDEQTFRSPELDFENRDKLRNLPVEKVDEAPIERHVDDSVKESSAKGEGVDSFAPNCMYWVVTAPCFNFFIFILILFNTLVLAMDDFNQNPTKTLIINVANQVFTWGFFLEMCLKIWGLGPRNYVKDSFNQFDAFVVTISIIDWVIALTIDQDDIGGASDALQALRALRLLRVIKLARSWTELQEILRKIAMSLKDIFYFTFLLILFLFIMSLLGMELFANTCRFYPDGTLVKNVQEATKEGKVMITPRANFDSISDAMVTMFIIILGEDWPGIMYNYVRVYGDNGWPISIFFMTCFAIGNFMLLSLFVAILLSNFENSDDDEGEEEEEDEVNGADSMEVKKKKPFNQLVSEFGIRIRYEYISAFGTNEMIEMAEEEMKLKMQMLQEKIERERTNIVSVFPLDQAESHRSDTPLKDSQSQASISDHQVQNDQEGANQVYGVKKPAIGKNLTQSQINKQASSLKQKRIVSSLAHVSLSLSVKADQHVGNKKKNRIKGRSLMCLGEDNSFRKLCFNITNHPWFDWIILIFICISTVMLAMEAPMTDPKSPQMIFLGKLDIIMTSIFILEMVLKIIAQGYICNGPKSYMKDPWCVLDFFIVLISILSIVAAEYNLTYLKALRMLRIMKPLRMLTMMRSLRLAIVSLFKSIPDILNLLLIVLFFIFLLAILCTTLFNGKFYRCHTDQLKLGYAEVDRLIKNKWDCLNYGGEWINPDLNFDTTSASVISLFTVQSTEGWIDVMWDAVDGVGNDQQPVLNQGRHWILFFIFLIIILCMLFLNLFVGVVCETFNKESALLSLNHLINKEKRQWISVQLMAYKAKPEVRLQSSTVYYGCFRNFCIRISNSPVFENFIMVCIIVNTLALAVVWNQMDPTSMRYMEQLNQVFMVIFTVECLIKLFAMRWDYYRDAWNQFDFIVVIGSLLALGIGLFSSETNLSMQATMVRVLRVLRVLRIIKRFQRLQIIFETIVVALPAMGSLGLLLLLLQFLFAIIGMQLFGYVMLQSDLDQHANFQSFANAFMLLMRCATGEGWNALMFDTARSNSITFQCEEHTTFETVKQNSMVANGCGSPMTARFYFICFQVIVSQVFLNLFIAIVVDTFILQKQAHDLPVTQFDIDAFVEVWRKYDPHGTGYIHWKDIEAMLRDLHEEDTSFFQADPVQITDTEMLKNLIIFLEFPMHKNLTSFYFYDVLTICCRYTCEMEHKEIEKLRHQFKISFMVDRIMACRPASRAIIFNAQNMYMREDQRCAAIFEQIFDTHQLDPRAEMKMDLNMASKSVNKKFQLALDSPNKQRADHEEEDIAHIYSSKHMFGAMKIIKGIQELVAKKDDGHKKKSVPIVATLFPQVMINQHCNANTQEKHDKTDTAQTLEPVHLPNSHFSTVPYSEVNQQPVAQCEENVIEGTSSQKPLDSEENKHNASKKQPR